MDSAKLTARKAGVDELLLEQIKESGLGSDLIFESIQSEGTVRLSNFVNFVYTM